MGKKKRTDISSMAMARTCRTPLRRETSNQFSETEQHPKNQFSLFRQLLCILQELLLCRGITLREQSLSFPVENVKRVHRHFRNTFMNQCTISEGEEEISGQDDWYVGR